MHSLFSLMKLEQPHDATTDKIQSIFFLFNSASLF
jgi:hypothetical protein